MSLLNVVPDSFPFEKKRVTDLKEKAQKKYASGLCAAFALLQTSCLHEGSRARDVWDRVPCDPDPKYDDICDSLWNAVAYWHKTVCKRGVKRPRALR